MADADSRFPSGMTARKAKTTAAAGPFALFGLPFGMLSLIGLLGVALVCMAGRVRVVSAGGQLVRKDVVAQPLGNPDAVCARCHAAIAASYGRTAMATGSGAAVAGLLPGEFTHAASGVRYRVFERDGRAWMSFARAGSSVAGAGGEGPSGAGLSGVGSRGAGALAGERELLYFVGSGRRGRTYLYQEAGEWFELPVNWYTRRGRWDMAPAYDDAAGMPAPLPVDANCLHCHASGVETPLAEAHNRFPERPFDQAGVGCSACHGDPAAHLAAEAHGAVGVIANPGKMDVAARDSACVQCHLEGDAVVYKPGRSLAGFEVGEKLSDVAVYFVRASQAGGGQRASSQYEALLKSACKRASGDELTCTTCHDPHSEPAAADRVSFYRARCVSCHRSPAISVSHHPEQPDCASCHMPSRVTADISHEQVTDHDIERVPGKAGGRPKWVDGEALVPVGGVPVSDRELGLAYAQRAEKGDRQAATRALAMLQRAEAAGADDEAVHVNLGWLKQTAGDAAGARREYAAALRGDPFSAPALVNRAVLDAGAGELAEAVRLLDRLVRADPSQTLAGVDLLQLECRAGEVERASALAETLRAVNPDAPELRALAGRGGCGVTVGRQR